MRAHRADYAIRSLGLIRLLILAFGLLLAAVLILSGGQPYGAPLDTVDWINFAVQYVVLAIVYALTYHTAWPRIHHPVGTAAVIILGLGSLIPYRSAPETFYQTQFVATSSSAIFAVYALVRLPWSWATVAAVSIVAYSSYFAYEVRPLPEGSMPMISWAFAMLMGFVVCRKGEQTDQLLFRARVAVDALLDSVYPKAVADRLRAGERVVADEIPHAAVLMLDIANFSAFAADRDAASVVRDLNDLYCLFDRLAEAQGVTKIKTSGDLYMAIATGENACLRLADFAQAIRCQASTRWSFRIGLHVGSAAAGVVGESRSLYDVWGDAVNFAARMEQTGERGKIQVSEAFANEIRNEHNLSDRGLIDIKGQGQARTYWLEQ